MKHFLLVLSFIGACFSGSSQTSTSPILLNEFYSDPDASEREFFELYNNGTETVNLNCYTLIAYIDQNSFYTITLPSINLLPGAIYTAAGGSPFNVKGSTNNIPDLDWTNTASGAVIKKYVRSGSTYTQTLVTPTATTPAGGILPDKVYKYFLFDNAGLYVNGFTSGSAAVPNLTAKNIPITGSCSYTIDWNKLTTAKTESNNGAVSSATSNGFARQGLGICGLWTKTSTSPAPSPTRTNPIDSKNNDAYGNKITANEAITCSGTKVIFKISSPVVTSIFPISVELYYDRNQDGSGSVDEFQSIITGITSSPLPYYNSFDITEANPLLVYKTSQGCITRVSLPTNANLSVTATQSNICDKWVSFSITAMSTDLSTFGQLSTSPLAVELHYDFDNDGVIDPGSEEIVQASTTVSAVPTTSVQNIMIPDQGYNILVVYKSSNTNLCFSQVSSAPFTTTGDIVVSGSISNTLDANGNRTVTYNIVNSATSSNAYGIILEVFEDLDKDGILDDNEKTPLGSQNIQTAPTTGTPDQLYTATLSQINSYAIVQGTSVSGCPLSIPTSISSIQIVLPVNFTSFTARRKGDKVLLNWETATELNNKGFHVQRNIDGEWKTIAFVFAATENGNSTTVNAYAFTDNNPAKGLTQYRLIQEDHDGRVAYSRTVPVQGTQGSSRLLVYPNPSTNGSVTLLFDNASSLRDVLVSDLAGRIVKQYRSVANGSLNVGYLLKGFYTIKVINRTTGATQVEKVIIK